MNGDKIACFLVERTGEMTPFVDGISACIYRRVDNGVRMHSQWLHHPDLPAMPPGAMWMDANAGLIVRTPGGDWHVDGQPRNGGLWTRDGTPPLVTVAGSILFAFDQEVFKKHGIPQGQRVYHGHLKAGVLEEC